ncbi:four helix bundle protein [Silvibacterium dinghuense]|uniref:Four helix bundle protein n=1 Tax=Silvibacterium dinghuense TaxID=1560006 RepID=A0A4Q1SBP3_9BACT|nr:four helix bundle protein [Silvibacterium dinghuense]RXS94445.1 four helix bundle protein [Silvibacterium dinghuense]GGH16059.1 four helix bundle protein [Silvibacterium dinghuense]
MLSSYQELIVWQKAMDLCVEIYRLTESFPRGEVYGLTSQLRRAGVSIASNIAEGYGRGSRGEYCQFLAIARGSNHEVQTQLLIAERLGFLTRDNRLRAEGLSEEIGRMLSKMLPELHPRDASPRHIMQRRG